MSQLKAVFASVYRESLDPACVVADSWHPEDQPASTEACIDFTCSRYIHDDQIHISSCSVSATHGLIPRPDPRLHGSESSSDGQLRLRSLVISPSKTDVSLNSLLSCSTLI